MDLVNKKYNRLLVIKFSHINKWQSRVWKCKCNCGNIIFASTGSLKGNNTRSCGCLQKEKASITLKNLSKHNLTYDVNGKKTRLFRIWTGMKSRCYNKNVTEYPRYGGKGVVICASWMNFKTFHGWAMNNGYRDNLTIDRKNNNGNYEPGNCRWATAKEQALNRKNNRFIEYKGESKILSQLAEEYFISTQCLWQRLKSGWSIEKALNTKVQIKIIT